jgi:hypothetical protein
MVFLALKTGWRLKYDKLDHDLVFDQRANVADLNTPGSFTKPDSSVQDRVSPSSQFFPEITRSLENDYQQGADLPARKSRTGWFGSRWNNTFFVESTSPEHRIPINCHRKTKKATPTQKVRTLQVNHLYIARSSSKAKPLYVVESVPVPRLVPSEKLPYLLPPRGEEEDDDDMSFDDVSFHVPDLDSTDSTTDEQCPFHTSLDPREFERFEWDHMTSV